MYLIKLEAFLRHIEIIHAAFTQTISWLSMLQQIVALIMYLSTHTKKNIPLSAGNSRLRWFVWCTTWASLI